MRFFLLGTILLLFHSILFGQNTERMVINQIEFNGVEKTKMHVLLRELTFSQGDTLHNAEEEIRKSQNNLYNTRLFHYVKYTFTQRNDSIAVTFNMQERWYLWPIPIFEYADPNLATWVRRKEIDYLNYGIVVEQRNFRGLNQKLRLKLRLGIREQYGIEYSFPKFGNNKNVGGYIETSFFRQKQIHTDIEDLQYTDIKADEYIYHEARAIAGVQWRPQHYAKHLFKIGYRFFNYNDSIDSLFGEPVSNKSHYLSIGYTFNYFRGDYVVYPLNGTKLNIQSELGLGKRSYAFADIQLGVHRELIDRLTFSYGANAFVSFTEQYPYFIFTGPAKNWYIRGFEDYIYQNDLMLLNRFQLKYTIVDHADFKFEFVPSEKFNAPFLSIFFNAFTEIGYGTNVFVDFTYVTPISAGVGVDFLTYYDWIGRLEIARNNLGETWFNVHWGYVF